MTDEIRDDIRKRHGLPDEAELTTADLVGANQPKPRSAHELLTETESESRDYPVAPVASDKSRTHAAAAAPAMEHESGPLFSSGEANELRSRWDAIQVGFVDEPRRAVELADNLVAGSRRDSCHPCDSSTIHSIK